MLRNGSRRFGGVKAVDGLDLTAHKGEILGLIGPNGSGKTTTVNVIAGLYAPTTGTPAFVGRDIGALAPHRRAELGIARTFQNIRLFGQLIVWQSLWAAEVVRERGWSGFKRRWLAGANAARESAEAMLACNLAFGEQRRLELARAAASGAPLLLLDEPAAGMNAEEIDELDARIRRLREQGRTILLIEHHMELVMEVCDRVVVLNFGRKIAEGTPAQVQGDPACRRGHCWRR